MDVIVNLGCADCPFWPRATDGAVNVDIIPTGNEDVRADARALPFRPGSVTGLYAHHLVEHLRREQVAAVLGHWHHTLRPGGFLSVVIPDWRKLAALSDPIERDRLLFGHDAARGPYQPHQSMWDERELVAALWRAGFVAVAPIDEATYTPLVARPGWQSGARGYRP